MERTTFTTSTGERIRYTGRFRYLIISRYWESRLADSDDPTVFRSVPVYNEDGTRARSAWDKVKRTDSWSTVEATVRRERYRGSADIEVIDTISGEIAYELHREAR